MKMTNYDNEGLFLTILGSLWMHLNENLLIIEPLQMGPLMVLSISLYWQLEANSLHPQDRCLWSRTEREYQGKICTILFVHVVFQQETLMYNGEVVNLTLSCRNINPMVLPKAWIVKVEAVIDSNAHFSRIQHQVRLSYPLPALFDVSPGKSWVIFRWWTNTCINMHITLLNKQT